MTLLIIPIALLLILLAASRVQLRRCRDENATLRNIIRATPRYRN